MKRLFCNKRRTHNVSNSTSLQHQSLNQSSHNVSNSTSLQHQSLKQSSHNVSNSTSLQHHCTSHSTRVHIMSARQHHYSTSHSTRVPANHSQCFPRSFYVQKKLHASACHNDSQLAATLTLTHNHENQ